MNQTILEHCALTGKLRTNDESLSKISFWDGKAESFQVYVSKIEAYTKFIDVEDAFDLILMEQCPILLQFATIDVTKPESQNLIDLYHAN